MLGFIFSVNYHYWIQIPMKVTIKRFIDYYWKSYTLFMMALSIICFINSIITVSFRLLSLLLLDILFVNYALRYVTKRESV